MNIAASSIRVQHDGILTIMSAYPQLNLRIIAADNQMSLRRLDEIPHPNGIIGLSRHVLAIGLGAVKPPGIRGQSKEIRMQFPRRFIPKL